MDKTVGYLLCCQSPMLFFLCIEALLCHAYRRKNHHIRAVIDMVLALLCAASGVGLYFAGMSRGYFTIHDFYHIRGAGWTGLAITAVVTVVLLVRAFLRYSHRRREEKDAIRAENQRLSHGDKTNEEHSPQDL